VLVKPIDSICCFLCAKAGRDQLEAQIAGGHGRSSINHNSSHLRPLHRDRASEAFAVSGFAARRAFLVGLSIDTELAGSASGAVLFSQFFWPASVSRLEFAGTYSSC